MKSNFSTGKNKVVFISYANEAMAYSLKRIGRQARRLGVFDEVILYTPSDVPEYVRQSPLFAYPRGAGYWCWKPAIIDETLKRQEDGTIVIYCDAGCTLRRSPRWAQLISQMAEYDSICFQYAESQPQWQKWGNGSSKMKYWAKRSALVFAANHFNRFDIGDFCQIWGGLLFFKGKDNTLLHDWKQLIFQHPDLIADPTVEELKEQYPSYAGHRHDQALLTPLAILDSKTLVLPEESEKYSPKTYVWASRIRARNWREYVLIQIKHYSRLLFGDAVFEKAKNLFFK